MRSLPYAEDRDRKRPRILRERTHFQVHHASNDREIPDPERLYIVPQGKDYGVGNGRDESLVAAIAMDTSVTRVSCLSWAPLEDSHCCAAQQALALRDKFLFIEGFPREEALRTFHVAE